MWPSKVSECVWCSVQRADARSFAFDLGPQITQRFANSLLKWAVWISALPSPWACKVESQKAAVTFFSQGAVKTSGNSAAGLGERAPQSFPCTSAASGSVLQAVFPKSTQGFELKVASKDAERRDAETLNHPEYGAQAACPGA